ncbi:hypothetical protein I79_011201 [Cricetulus griseus]|uniref:Uncharacterized protein n=1 Tax=Cricetulus griseus TaxID=10029 RepID=G3HKH5_CRIGR|nr:hypothetical protein I79_011201 [Cricetulus griseus]
MVKCCSCFYHPCPPPRGQRYYALSVKTLRYKCPDWRTGVFTQSFKVFVFADAL